MKFAGVAVRRGVEVRLAVAFHKWKREYAKGSLHVYRADRLRAEVGPSDIGHQTR